MVKDPKQSDSDEGARLSDESIDVPDRGEATVEITDAPRPSVRERIHRRRPAPPVPDAEPPEGD
jgi:hypothetical protein